MTDVSQILAKFRASNPAETIGKTDKEVADIMLAKGGLSYEELSALTKAFAGQPAPIGDLAEFSKGKDVPLPKDESKRGWIAAGIAFLGAGALSLFTRGKGGKAVASLERAIGGNAGKIIKTTMGVAGGVAAAASLQSCSQDNFTDVKIDGSTQITFDYSEIRELIELLKTQHYEDQEKYNEILAALDKMETDLGSLNTQMEQMMSLVKSVLNSVVAGNSDLAALLAQILEKIEDGYDINMDMLEDILIAIKNMSSEQGEFNETALGILNEIVQKMDDMSTTDKAFYEKIISTIENISVSGSETANELTEILQGIWDSVKDGNNLTQNQTTVVNNILEAITNMKDADAETAEKLSAVLQQILEAVNSGNELTANQTTVLNDILTIISSLSDAAPDAVESITDLLNEIIASIKEGTEVNIDGFNAVKELLSSIKASNAENTNAVIDAIKAMWEDIAAGNQKIIDAIIDLSNSGSANNKELMEFIKGLYDDSQISSDQRVEKIIEAINSVGEMVTNLENTVNTTGDAISNAIKDMSTQLEELLNAYKEGNASMQDITKQLETILNSVDEGNGIGTITNELLTELLEEVNQIISNGGEITDYTDLLNQILEAINSVASGIGDLKLSIGENNDNIIAALEEIIDNQNIQTTALKEFAAQSTAYQQQLIEQGNSIIKELQSIGTDMNASISNVIDTIKESNAELAAQLAALVDSLGLKMDDNTSSIVNAIDGLKGNLTAIEDAISNLIDASGDGNLDLTTTNNLIQTVINLLVDMNDPTYGDLSEVVSMIATTNDLLQKLLDKDTSNDATAIVDALNEMMEVLKNMNVSSGSGSNLDLTTTNNLIQTCIEQLSMLIQLSAVNSDIMVSVTNLGTQLTEVISSLQSGNVTTDEINEKLDTIMAQLEELTNSINK